MENPMHHIQSAKKAWEAAIPAGVREFRQAEERVKRNPLMRAPISDPQKAIVQACAGDEDSHIHPGDLVAVDFTVQKFDADAVFAVAFDGGMAFRTVQRIPSAEDGRVRICFRHNGKYDVMSDEVLAGIEVIGRVLEIFHSDNRPALRQAGGPKV